MKCLNINGLYWVPLDDLRKILKLLTNLEELCALDTKLGVRDKDLILYSKLRKLALSVEALMFPKTKSIVSNNLYLLRKLCLKVIRKKQDFHELYDLFNEIIGLEELWIYDADDSIFQALNYDCIVGSLKFLNKLAIISKVSIPLLDYKHFGLAKVFDIRRFHPLVCYYVRIPNRNDIVRLRHLSIFEPYETKLESAWGVLQRFRCEMPYGVQAAEKIYITKSLKDVEFDELNFKHKSSTCSPRFIQASLDILMSGNSKNLKKLCIDSCILQLSGKNWSGSTAGRTTPFKDIVENCKYIEELEIGPCLNCNVTVQHGYPVISQLKELRRLFLDIPKHVDGKFLTDVFINCKQLRSLSIVSDAANEKLNMNIYCSLHEASNLKDFRFENVHINVTRLFSTLNLLAKRVIQRVLIKCRYADIYGLDELKTFLETNDQLLFMYTAISENTVSQNSQIQEVFNNCKNGVAAKIYFAKKDEGYFTGNFPIPEAHKDMLSTDTRVSLLDFNQF